MKKPQYNFISTAGRVINSGQSRSIVITGNVSDLFCVSKNEKTHYMPLLDLLSVKWKVKDSIVITYKLNGLIRFGSRENKNKLRQAWSILHNEHNQQAIDLALAGTQSVRAALKAQPKSSFDKCVKKARLNPVYALEFLKQLCICSRSVADSKPLLNEYLIILIENADFLIPQGEIGRLNDADRQRVSICRDWFSDPDFFNGEDTVILLSETISALNTKISSLPQIVEVKAPSPDYEQRKQLIEWFINNLSDPNSLKIEGSIETLANLTAGLSCHALIQMLRQASHTGEKITPQIATAKVESHIKHLLGEDVIEFKKPEHGLEDVVGFKKLKKFFADEFIPRIKSTDKSALPGAVIGGPVGSGKSFILEAVAGELGIVVLVLKNIRSKWFGDTDVIFERLRSVIEALDKSLVFVDEADTQFGSVSSSSHETERRLTGKIQAMMSDPRLRGKTSWLLITARIHLLSPDIRRPGRAGSLVIPITDPEESDKDEFIQWMIKPVFKTDEKCESISCAVQKLKQILQNYYSAAYAETRSDLIATAVLKNKKTLTLEEIVSVIKDRITPAVQDTRKYQTLQAMVNCTRLSLLPEAIGRDEVETCRSNWLKQIKQLESYGDI